MVSVDAAAARLLLPAALALAALADAVPAVHRLHVEAHRGVTATAVDYDGAVPVAVRPPESPGGKRHYAEKR